MDEQSYFLVRYVYGTYSGERHVWARDEDEAIRKVRRELRPHMTLPMAAESYKAEAL